MSTYYEVIATHSGYREVLFGSFAKKDCKYEVDAEKESWKDQGYTNITITPRETDESPDPSVYPEGVL